MLLVEGSHKASSLLNERSYKIALWKMWIRGNKRFWLFLHSTIPGKRFTYARYGPQEAEKEEEFVRIFN